MFNTLVDNILTSISVPFNFLESLFGSLGLSFILVFTVMLVSSFIVRSFIRIFFSPHI